MRLRQPSFPDPLSFRCSVGRAEPQVLFRAASPQLCRISCIMAVSSIRMPAWTARCARPLGLNFLPSLVALVIAIRTLSPLASSALASKLGSRRVQEHGPAVYCKVWSSTPFASAPLSPPFLVLVATGLSAITNNLLLTFIGLLQTTLSGIS